MALSQTPVNTPATGPAISQPAKDLRRILATWLDQGMRKAGLNQSSLAERSGVSRDTIWRILHQKTGASEESLQKLSEAIGQALPEVYDAKGPYRVAERALRPVTGRREIEELDADPDRPGEGPGWQWDSTDYTQLSDDDVLGMLLHDRPGFLRYLQRQFEKPVPTPLSAKLGFLEFIEKMAKEKGVPVSAEHLETLRRLIRERYV